MTYDEVSNIMKVFAEQNGLECIASETKCIVVMVTRYGRYIIAETDLKLYRDKSPYNILLKYMMYYYDKYLDEDCYFGSIELKVRRYFVSKNVIIEVLNAAYAQLVKQLAIASEVTLLREIEKI